MVPPMQNVGLVVGDPHRGYQKPKMEELLFHGLGAPQSCCGKPHRTSPSHTQQRPSPYSGNQTFILQTFTGRTIIFYPVGTGYFF